MFKINIIQEKETKIKTVLYSVDVGTGHWQKGEIGTGHNSKKPIDECDEKEQKKNVARMERMDWLREIGLP